MRQQRERLLTWAMEHRDGAQTLVRYYRDEAARHRDDEEAYRRVERHAAAASHARDALRFERMWKVNERRLNWWDMIACWLGAASVVPGRGLNL